jgi:hypothetical protein
VACRRERCCRDRETYGHRDEQPLDAEHRVHLG